MQIAGISINGKAALAPMAGVTDAAFRKICADLGAAYTVTEMVSAKAIQYQDKKTDEIAALEDDARPTAIQLFGDDPDVLALAAVQVLRYRPDAIDINMGCPAPKIAGNNSGSALMRNPELCGRIVAAVKKAVSVPVTVKIRKGYDNHLLNAVEVAKYCEAAGADAIAVHGRTRPQMYSGQADWQTIRDVKQAVCIPVIGNGDIANANDAAGMLEETGCDLVMVGRGALGNPWIFREINAYLQDKTTVLPPPGIAERLLLIREHIAMTCARKGEARAMREARKQVAWYMHGLPGAAEFRRRAGALSTFHDLETLIQDVYTKSLEQRAEERFHSSQCE